MARVEALLARGTAPEALRQAKALHRQASSAESAALLAKAYGARIDAMIMGGMRLEAEALIETAIERLPAHEATFLRRRDYLAAWYGAPAGLLRPWRDPSLPADRRASLGEELRCWVRDPRTVRDCEVLPTEHPLRQAAAAVAAAFAAVTSGPVAAEALALPAVSRRGPFAPWALLIRAIEAFHREDDEACRRALSGVPADSAVAGLAPLLEHMMAGGPQRKLSGKARRLFAGVMADDRRLRAALEELDEAIREGEDDEALWAIREAVAACEQARPDLLDGLRLRIAIRAFLEEIEANAVARAMGGPSRKDADFWRLFAQGAERLAGHEGDLAMLFDACAYWNAYRRHAIAEGRLAPGGAAEAAVYLRIASVLRDAGPEVRRNVAAYEQRTSGLRHYYVGQPKEIRALAPPQRPDTWFVHPEIAYERAAKAHPAPSIFQTWLEWARGAHRHWRPADEAALAWHRALPRDPRPLLYLTESAERRNALDKAMKYLGQVEELDPMNSGARRARLRLLVAKTRRHIRAARLPLAREDIASLAALPELADPLRGCVLAALAWSATAGSDEKDEVPEEIEHVVRGLGSELAARALLSMVAVACGLDPARVDRVQGPLPALLPPGAFAAAAAAAAEATARMEMEVALPPGWKKRIMTDLSAGAGDVAPERLLLLAHAALRQGEDTLAYTAAGAGLASTGPLEARFLLVRAQSMPRFALPRALRCLKTALALSRLAGDTETVGRVLAAHGELRSPPSGRRSSLASWRRIPPLEPGSAEEIREVLRREREATRYPTPATYDPSGDGEVPAAPCDCPHCRRARARFGGAFRNPFDDDDDDDDDFDDDFDDDGGPFGDARDGKIALPEPLGKALDEYLQGLSDERKLELADVLETMGRGSGPLPDLGDLARMGPEPFYRMMDMFKEAFGLSAETDEPAPGGGGPRSPRGGSSKARGRRKR